MSKTENAMKIKEKNSRNYIEAKFFQFFVEFISDIKEVLSVSDPSTAFLKQNKKFQLFSLLVIKEIWN